MEKRTLARRLLNGEIPSGTPSENVQAPGTEASTNPPAEGGDQPPAETTNPPADPGTPPAEEGKPAEEGAAPAEGVEPKTVTPGTQPDPAKVETKVEAPAVAVTDESVLEFLKAKGIQVDKLDDLKPVAKELTPEEQAAADEELRAKAINFGLANNEFDAKLLTQYYRETARDARDIALEVFAEQQRDINPDLTDAEVEAQFADLYYETEEDTDPRRINAGKRMQQVAQSYLNNKYEKIVGAPDKFKQYQQVERTAQSYRSTVESVAASIGDKLTFEVTIKDANDKPKTLSYDYNLPPDAIAAVKDSLLKEDTFARLGDAEMNEAFVRSAMNGALIQREHAKIVATVADAHAAAVLAEAKLGRRGIPVTELESGDTRQDVRQPYQGKARERLKQAEGAA